MSRRFRRQVFWLLVILGLVVLLKLLTYLIHLSISLIIILVAVILIWILFQAGKSKWL